MALMMTEKKGSIALTVCVNDTATCGTEWNGMVEKIGRGVGRGSGGGTDLRRAALRRTEAAASGGPAARRGTTHGTRAAAAPHRPERHVGEHVAEDVDYRQRHDGLELRRGGY